MICMDNYGTGVYMVWDSGIYGMGLGYIIMVWDWGIYMVCMGYIWYGTGVYSYGVRLETKFYGLILPTQNR